MLQKDKHLKEMSFMQTRKDMSKVAKEQVGKILDQAKISLKTLEAVISKLPGQVNLKTAKKEILPGLKKLGLATQDDLAEIKERLSALEEQIKNNNQPSA